MNRFKISLLTGLLIPLLQLNAIAAPITAIDDPFDNDWLIAGAGTGWFTGTSPHGGLDRLAGTHLFHRGDNNTSQRIFKHFETDDFTAEGQTTFNNTNLFIAGEYTISLMVGHPEHNWTSAGFTSTNDLNFFLTTGSGTDEFWEDRIPHTYASVIEKPIPALTNWVMWSVTYSIDENTLNNNGDPVIGMPIGMLIDSPQTGNNRGFSLDDMQLTYIPEPSSVVMLVLGAAGMFAVRRRLIVS